MTSLRDSWLTTTQLRRRRRSNNNSSATSVTHTLAHTHTLTHTPTPCGCSNCSGYAATDSACHCFCYCWHTASAFGLRRRHGIAMLDRISSSASNSQRKDLAMVRDVDVIVMATMRSWRPRPYSCLAQAAMWTTTRIHFPRARVSWGEYTYIG